MQIKIYIIISGFKNFQKFELWLKYNTLISLYFWVNYAAKCPTTMPLNVLIVNESKRL